MDVEFDDPDLERLEIDPKFNAGYESSIVKVFRKRLQFIRAANDERVFYSMKSLHYEKLLGNLSGQCSMRLNNQWRLILRIKQSATGKQVVVVSITDYH